MAATKETMRASDLCVCTHTRGKHAPTGACRGTNCPCRCFDPALKLGPLDARKRGPHDFAPGDTVQLTGQFLKNTGQRAGGEGPKKWIVLRVEPAKNPHDFTMIVVNEPKDHGDLQYFTVEELAADPWLRWRRINAKNLKRVGMPSLRDVY